MRGTARKIVTVVLLLLVLGGCAFLLLRGLRRSAETGEVPSLKRELVELLSDNALTRRVRDWFAVEPEYEKAPSGESVAVRDLSTLYKDSEEERVLYLTVQQGTRKAGTDHSWTDLNAYPLSWYAEQGIEPYECEALVQFGNEVGPVMGMFGFGDTVPNAMVRLAGSNASTRPQKSYRITINANAGDVDGMKKFVLFKSFGDPFRFTEKLVCGLMAEGGFLSSRTSFVHLYVRDATEPEEDREVYVDYGLYTMVEAVNKRYLSNRNLSTDCELYKAVNFDFERHEDVIMQPTAAAYDEKRFEAILENKGDNDYSKLIALLDAVNDENTDIREIVKQFFDKDNLYGWLAFRILLDDQDTGTENFYLYSPTGSDKFYIIPWDSDGALRRDYERLRDPDWDPGREKGVFRFAGSLLFRRILQNVSCTNTLGEYIYQLYTTVLSPAHVAEKAEALAELVLPQLYAMPDVAFARVTEADYRRLLEQLPQQIEENYYAYYDSLETPWPFHIHLPERVGDGILLSWDEAYSSGQAVSYTVELDDAWDFLDPIVRVQGTEDNSLSVDELPPGQYFVRVRAKGENGNVQSAFENYYTEKKTTAQSVLCFYVTEDGSVVGAAG